MILLLSGAAGFFLMGANYALYGVAASYYPCNVAASAQAPASRSAASARSSARVLAGVLLGGGTTATNVMHYMAPAAAIAAIAVFALSFRPKPEH